MGMASSPINLRHGQLGPVILILLVLLVQLSWAQPAPAATKNYVDQTLGYSLALPESWVVKVKPGSGGRSLVFSGAKGTKDYASTISLQIIPAGSYANLAKVAEDLTRQWSHLQGYRLLSRQSGRLASRPGLRLVAEYQPTAGGSIYRQEQFVCQGGNDWYLLAYTAPVRIFQKFHGYMANALESFTLSGAGGAPGRRPAAPAAPASRAHEEKMLAASFGPTALKQAGGPLFAPSYDNGTFQGRQVARAVASMVGTQSVVLRKLAQRQAQVLAMYDKLGGLQASQAALLQAELATLPAEVKKLFKLQAEYTLLQDAQRGAVEGALAALPAPDLVSGDLAGVQSLAALQAGLSDQQALILRQNQDVWSAGMLLYQNLGKESSGLPAHLRLRLAQLNRKQQKAALELIDAVGAMNGCMANLIMVLDLWAEFQLQVGRAYAQDLSNALPSLRAQAQRLRAADPHHPALAVIQATIKALDITQQNLKLSSQSSAASLDLWQYLGDLAVPPAHAGAWDFTKRFAENSYYAGRIAITATLNVPRLAAQGVGHAAERLGQELSYGSIKTLNVTSDPEAILPSADEIIKRNPQLAPDRYKLIVALRKIKKRHKVESTQDYLKLKKATIDANVAEYRSKKYGARALGGAVKSIDKLKDGVETGAEGATQDFVRSVGGDFAGDTVGYVAGKVNGFVAGVAFGVVADIPKSVAVLLNPKATWSEQAKASFDLAGSMGGGGDRHGQDRPGRGRQGFAQDDQAGQGRGQAGGAHDTPRHQGGGHDQQGADPLAQEG